MALPFVELGQVCLSREYGISSPSLAVEGEKLKLVKSLVCVVVPMQ